MISLFSGLPPRSAEIPSSVNVGVPAGSEFKRNRPETLPVIPQAEVAGQAGTAGDAPQVGDTISETAPSADTASAAAPAPTVSVPDAPLSVDADSGLQPSAGQGDTQPPGLAGQPSMGSPDATVETVPTAPSMPVIRKSGEIVPREEPDPKPAAAAALPAPPAQETAELPETEPALPAETTEAQTEVDAPEASVPEAPQAIRLPTIGDQDEPLVIAEEAPEPVTQEPADAALPEDDAGIGTLGALARNSAPFDRGDDDRPLFSIVLIDAGSEGLGSDALTTFSFPVTIAVDPASPGAAEKAANYRNAGYEVLVLADPVATGQSAADISNNIQNQLLSLPQAIGVVDAETAGFGSNARVVERVIEALGETSHGLLTYDRGLNTAQQIAEREGLSSALIFRMLDAQKENPTTIGRYLDRAAFKAAQEGSVVMIGHSYADTVTALFSWMLEPRSQSVRMAPLSAIMRQ
jgi:polysaccharide deacetylase 2 family uncharacterized protein YibQ